MSTRADNKPLARRNSAFEQPSYFRERTETLTELGRFESELWRWRQDAAPHAGLEVCRYVAAAILGCQ